MKRLPLLADNQSSTPVRVASLLIVPLILLVLLPILLVVILAVYLAALFHGIRFFVIYVVGKTPETDLEVRKPHFLELPGPTNPLLDDTTATAPSDQ